MKTPSLMIATVLLLSACGGKPPLNLEGMGIQTKQIQTSNYVLQTIPAKDKDAKHILLHIEGDGAAYITKTRPSYDPTPRTSVMLEMMQYYAPSNSMYIGRSCQYVQTPNCSVKDWTTERYTQRHVDALSEAIDKIKKSTNAETFTLIGHSGGGTMATLVANKRKQRGQEDISGIITLAANLNMDGFVRHHNVTPMKGTDPVTIAPNIKDIPQFHYSGYDDRIVTKELPYKYMLYSGKKCAQFRDLFDVSHNAGWTAYATEIYENTPKCK